MITFASIEQQYPENLRPFKRAILREYLQYKILEIIFASAHAAKLSFLGGTALRILWGNMRFSEDLDFDNFGMGEGEFSALAEAVRVGLEAEGLHAEMTLAGKDAYRCNIRFPDVLQGAGLSPHADEKILIQIDSLAHGFSYRPEGKLLNKFDVFTEIFATPINIILSQKFYAAINRRRAKGRDFFDIVFLLSLTRPNYAYVREKIGVSDAEALRAKILDVTADFDFMALARDVRPFLFKADDARRVEKFREYMTQVDLR